MIDLDKLLELESKATPEKWSLECYPTPNSEWCKFNFLSPHGYVLTCYAGEVTSHVNDVLLMNSMRENFRQLCLELKASRKVVEAARPFVRALDLVQMSGVDISKGWDKELALQQALKELDGKNG